MRSRGSVSHNVQIALLTSFERNGAPPKLPGAVVILGGAHG